MRVRPLDVVFWTFFGGGVLFILGIWIRMIAEAVRDRRRRWTPGSTSHSSGTGDTGGISGSHDTSVGFADFSSTDSGGDTSAGEAGGGESGGGGDFGGAGSSGSWS